MTMEKAERIAHQLVQSWSPIDVQTALMKSLETPGENHLCSSIDNHFAKNEKRIFKIGRKLRDAVNDDEMFFEHERLVFTASITRQKAAFLLGFASALRLLGVDDIQRKKRRR